MALHGSHGPGEAIKSKHMPALESKDADRVEQDEKRTDLMEDRRGDRTKNSEPGQHYCERIEPECKEQDVLTDDANCVAGEPHGFRQRGEWVAHQDDGPGLGGQIGAGAREREPDVGAGERKGVVDPIAQHGHDPARLLALLDPFGFAGGVKLGLYLLDVDFLADGLGRGSAVAGQDGKILEPQMLQVVNHVVRLPAHAVARSDDAGNPVAMHEDERGLPGLVELANSFFYIGVHGDAVLAHQPKVADQDRAYRRVGGTCRLELCQDSRSGLSLEFRNLRQTEIAPAGLGDQHARQGMLARLLGRGGQPENVLCLAGIVGGCPAVVGKRDAVDELGLAFGERACLIEGNGVDSGQGLDGCAPFDEHAAAGEPGGGGENRRGGGEHEGARAGDHKDR